MIKKKILMVIFILLTAVVPGFSQENKDDPFESGKIVLRVHTESLIIMGSEVYYDPILDDYNARIDSLDSSIQGLGLSTSLLFWPHHGLTLSFGILYLGVDDPLGSSKFSKDRVGGFFKMGPYFRFGRIGLSPMFEIVGIYEKARTKNYLAGLSCEMDLFLKDSFALYLGASILGGFSEVAFSLSLGVGFAF